MKLLRRLVPLGLLVLPSLAGAEILAMLNYETKSEESLKALKLSMPGGRREGIAFIDVDPASPGFGNIVKDVPLPAGLVAHHIFYNRDQSKAYVTALGKSELHVIDMADPQHTPKMIPLPNCMVGEDVVFSADNSRWFVTCMGSNRVITGESAGDTVTGGIDLSTKYPHGIAVHDGIDRILVTSTVRASDLGDAGETITAIEMSSGRETGVYKVSGKPSPAAEAPVEILFVPKSDPPVAYVTNMFGGSLWAAVWNADKKSFDTQQVIDFTPMNAGVPLEMYFNDAGDRFYVTTAKPGNLHVYDISGGPLAPKHIKTIDAGEGAHHVAFTRDWKYAYVQNSLLNLPGMSEGTITVVDLATLEVVRDLDTLSSRGFNPNSIVLLPDWNHPAGH